MLVSTRSLSTLALLALLAVACGDTDDDPAPATSSTTTSSASGMGGDVRMGAGGAATSAGGMGGGVPLAGFGSLTGDCGELDSGELLRMSPGVVLTNTVDFPATPYMYGDLSMGGQTIFDDPNAGGSSKDSELFAFEVLHRCELATLLKTETEIDYTTTGPITDMLVEIDGLKIGVSVVRAFKFMGGYTLQDALPILTNKLDDIQQSSASVSAADAWEKQILSVVAEKPENATIVGQALDQIDVATRGDTVVVITVTEGDDAFVY